MKSVKWSLQTVLALISFDETSNKRKFTDQDHRASFIRIIITVNCIHLPFKLMKGKNIYCIFISVTARCSDFRWFIKGNVYQSPWNISLFNSELQHLLVKQCAFDFPSEDFPAVRNERENGQRKIVTRQSCSANGHYHWMKML